MPEDEAMVAQQREESDRRLPLGMCGVGPFERALTALLGFLVACGGQATPEASVEDIVAAQDAEDGQRQTPDTSTEGVADAGVTPTQRCPLSACHPVDQSTGQPCDHVHPPFTPFAQAVATAPADVFAFTPSEVFYLPPCAPVPPAGMNEQGRLWWLLARPEASNWQADPACGHIDRVWLDVAKRVVEPLTLCLRPKGYVRDAESVFVFGGAKPALAPAFAARLSRSGEVKWVAKTEPALLKAVLPAHLWAGYAGPLMQPKDGIQCVSDRVGGIWCTRTARAASGSPDGADVGTLVFLHHLTASGEHTLPLFVYGPRRNERASSSSTLAVHKTGLVAVVDPVPGNPVKKDEHSPHSNPIGRAHCYDPVNGPKGATVIVAPDAYEKPIDVVASDDGFHVLSAVFKTTDHYKDSSQLATEATRGIRTLRVTSVSLDCKMLGSRTISPFGNDELVLGTLFTARPPSGGLVLLGRSKPPVAKYGSGSRGAYLLFDEKLRLIKAIQDPKRMDLVVPQVMDDGRIVRQLTEITATPDGSAKAGACYYEVSDPWFHSSCDDAGVCFALTPADCHTDDPCRIPACDPVTGCHTVPLAEGTACGTGGICTKGQCVK